MQGLETAATTGVRRCVEVDPESRPVNECFRFSFYLSPTHHPLPIHRSFHLTVHLQPGAVLARTDSRVAALSLSMLAQARQ